MPTDDLFRSVRSPGESGDRMSRRRRDQHGVLGGEAVELSKQPHLDVEVLGDRLDDQVRFGDRVREGIREYERVGDVWLMWLPTAISVTSGDRLPGALELLRADVEAGRRAAGSGERPGDGCASDASSDYRHGLDRQPLVPSSVHVVTKLWREAEVRF